MSIGPFKAFFSQRDNKQYHRRIMGTDDKIFYCFQVGGCCVLGTLVSSGFTSLKSVTPF